MGCYKSATDQATDRLPGGVVADANQLVIRCWNCLVVQEPRLAGQRSYWSASDQGLVYLVALEPMLAGW